MASISDAEVHVWIARAQGVVDAGVLSPAERLRAEQRPVVARVSFVAAHIALREVVGRYVNTGPAQVRLDTRAGSAPTIEGCSLSLSLSHTNELALVAVSQLPVGVDVERAGAIPFDEAEALASSILSPDEAKRFARLKDELRPQALTRAWTHKEATLKAHGLGLSQVPMDRVGIRPAGARQSVVSIPGREVAFVHELDLGDRFVGCVATLQRNACVSAFELAQRGRVAPTLCRVTRP